jgi:NADPH2 dehydrogenase
VKLDDRYPLPHAMTIAEIQEFVEQMQAAARRADQAGFDGVEIHAAHGYLINQFLSSITNQRTDPYGGSAENRSRVLREIVAAVEAVLPAEKALNVRVSAEEYLSEGLHPQDVAAMLNQIPSGIVDAINVSSGGLAAADFPVFPGYQVRLAEAIHSLTGLPVMAGGLIYDPILANEIVANGRADFVFVGRGLLHDAAWVINAQRRLGHEQTWPKPYQGALARMNF